jgi:mRNA-degrading endonuclease RelE of RelBE toxin-antitoxin system
MNYRISKEFDKSAKKLSGKYKESLRDVIVAIKSASSISELSDCKKLIGFKNIYRIRMGNYRIFFFIEIIDNTVYLKYLVSRGEAYGKEYQQKLKRDDK